jgi:hypothetical protein
MMSFLICVALMFLGSLITLLVMWALLKFLEIK